MFKTVFLATVAVAMLGGCATITRGSSEAFIINSTPSGANVRLSSGETCITPCTLERKRKKEFVVFISKTGFEPVEVSVLSQVAGAGAVGMAGNIFLGVVIGAAIDYGTGATKKLVPNPLKVVLQKMN
ncbi:MAG: PEGA domain-containing protein [Chloroflexi bacterium]|nr:PEGA domain-containing protein [Chloroflexota bacterium]